MKRTIKLICFDVGGTLVYHAQSSLAFTLHDSIFKKYDIDKHQDAKDIRARLFDARIHKNLDTVIRRYMKTINVKKNRQGFFTQFKNDLANQHKTLRYYPETKSVLNALRKQRYRIAFITNWNQFGRDCFDYIGLSAYADHIIISAEHGKRKPHPFLFKKALTACNVKPSEVLMVGDKYEKDYLPAKKLGIRALLIERKTTKHHNSIKNLKEIIPYLKQHNHTN